MSLERVNPAELGPASGFSHAVVAEGRQVFLAGQTALDEAGRLVGTGIVEQFDQALANLLMALAAVGGRPDQLVTLTVYLTDIDDYKAHTRELGAVWKTRVGPTYPAMAAVGATRLWDPAALVELQGMAVI